MRVLSWNVRSLRDDARGVAAFLRASQPDVALIQEAPRLLLWRWSCARLARRSGLRRVVGGAPAAGNLLLVSDRVRVVQAQAVRLPKRHGLHRRGAVIARLDIAGLGLTVLGTHLDLEPSARLGTAVQLRARDLAGPLVDVGTGCGPTFPRNAPARRIGGVFVAPSLEVRSVARPDPGPLTDHLPLVVDLA